LSLSHGPHHLGRYDAAGEPLPPRASPELSRGRGTAPFPCNPIPKINPAVEARLAPLNPKPDLSLATKSDLLRTLMRMKPALSRVTFRLVVTRCN
jgi:hypothetical protein